MLKSKINNKINIIVIIIFLSIVLIIGTSCKNNPMKPSNKGYWNHYIHEHSYFNFITNGRVVNDRLHCTVRQGILIFEDFKDHPEHIFKDMISAGYDFKPIISDEYVAYIRSFQSDEISFTRNDASKYSNYATGESISPIAFGDEFSDFSFHVRRHHQIDFGVFRENRFITIIAGPYYQIDWQGPYKYVVYADIERNGSNSSITNKGVYDIPFLSEQRNAISSIAMHNNNVYISTIDTHTAADKLIEISEIDIVKVSNSPLYPDQIAVLFTYQGYLCAWLNTTAVVYSSDGESWQYAFSIRPIVYEWYEIDDYLFIPLYHRIYFIEGEITDPKLYQLPISNMEGVIVSSIHKFQENLVITTSHGIFYKQLKDIAKDKIFIGTSSRGLLNLAGV